MAELTIGVRNLKKLGFEGLPHKRWPPEVVSKIQKSTQNIIFCIPKSYLHANFQVIWSRNEKAIGFKGKGSLMSNF